MSCRLFLFGGPIAGVHYGGLPPAIWHLYNQQVTTCKFCKSLILTFIQNAGGVGGITRSQSLYLKSASIGRDFYVQFPFAWPIKFAQEHALPAPQRQLSALHENDLARSHEDGFYMRVRIALSVLVGPHSGD